MTDRCVYFGQRSEEPGWTYIFPVPSFEGRPGTLLRRQSDGKVYTVVEYEPSTEGKAGMARCISDEPFVIEDDLQAWIGSRDRVDG